MSSFELLDHIHDEHLHGQDHQHAAHAGGAAAHAAHAGHAGGAGGKVRVFGADWCPWTRKQKEALQDANIEFEFIDCAEDNGKELCVGITGFPTLDIGGNQSAGFKDANQIKSLL